MTNSQNSANHDEAVRQRAIFNAALDELAIAASAKLASPLREQLFELLGVGVMPLPANSPKPKLPEWA